MTINWGALGIVAVGEPADAPLVIGGGGSRLSRVVGTMVAAVCLLGAAAIVVYGFYLLVF